jgi:hypothetical protein
LLIVAIAGIAFTWKQTRPAPITSAGVPLATPANTEPEKQTISIRRGDTLEALLDRSGVQPDVAADVIAAVRSTFDVKTFRAGEDLALRLAQGKLVSLEYVIDPDNRLEVTAANGKFIARVAEVPGTVRPRAICSTLEGSLFESMGRTGEQPELALRIAEILPGTSISTAILSRVTGSACLLRRRSMKTDRGQPTGAC